MALVPVSTESDSAAVVGSSRYDWLLKPTDSYEYTGSASDSAWKQEAKRYPINYEKLRELVSIDGLKTDKDESSTPEAHATFMKTVQEIFLKPIKTDLPAVALQTRNNQSIPSIKSTGPTAARTNTTAVESEGGIMEDEHDVREYMKQIRKPRKGEVDITVKSDGIKVLRKLLQKLPFERTGEDIATIYKALKACTKFSRMVSNTVLKELCYVAQLDTWKDEDFPVFGSSGMHLILKGSVTSQSLPYIYNPKTPLNEFKREWTNNKHSSSKATNQHQVLSVGECFGTFVVIDGVTMNKHMLMVNTKDPNCEFLKVTTSEYNRVIEQIKNKEQTKKLNLLQACPPFKMWTRQPKLRVANLIEWQNFPPNTGECHVLKQLEVLQSQPSGTKEKKTKQVVIGKIGANESFAETSILKEEPMTCSIITATDVTLGTISPVNLYSLDQTTLDLLEQSCQPNIENMSREKIEQEYMEQELKREWNQYRHNAVIEAINAQGVRPGYGKWSKIN